MLFCVKAGHGNDGELLVSRSRTRIECQETSLRVEKFPGLALRKADQTPPRGVFEERIVFLDGGRVEREKMVSGYGFRFGDQAVFRVDG